MNLNCVVTGGGSGVGRAVALKLVNLRCRVAIIGRRIEALRETVQLAGDHGARLSMHACDISQPEQVGAAARRVLDDFRSVDALINCAGTNVPRRALEVLSLEDYHDMIGANLNGAYYWTQELLPGMRARGNGTIINVISDAGKLASPKAGPGYVVSKFGLAGLTQSINAEERARGIRACAIFPGDIDTPLLEKRPQLPDADARARMMRAEDVAECVWFCLHLPPHVIVEEMLVRPR